MRRAFAIAVAASLLLGACTHARVVQREPRARPAARAAASRPAMSPLPRSGVHVVATARRCTASPSATACASRTSPAWNGIPIPT
jgi:hypothetical protein